MRSIASSAGGTLRKLSRPATGSMPCSVSPSMRRRARCTRSPRARSPQRGRAKLRNADSWSTTSARPSAADDRCSRRSPAQRRRGRARTARCWSPTRRAEACGASIRRRATATALVPLGYGERRQRNRRRAGRRRRLCGRSAAPAARRPRDGDACRRCNRPRGENAAGIDGLYWHDGALIGIQNVTTPGARHSHRARGRRPLDHVDRDAAVASSGRVRRADDRGDRARRPVRAGAHARHAVQRPGNDRPAGNADAAADPSHSAAAQLSVCYRAHQSTRGCPRGSAAPRRNAPRCRCHRP